MNFVQLFILALGLLSWYPGVETAKILGLFPTSSRSHYIVDSALMKALAERGHEVTVVSPFPQSKPLKNYRDVTTTDIWQASEPFISNILNFNRKSPFANIMRIYNLGHAIVNSTLNDPAVVKLIDSKEHFDLVILEIFMTDAMLAITSNLLSIADDGVLESIRKTYAFGHTTANETLKDAAITALLNSDDKFDLIILEIFMNDAMLGFAHHFKAPCIGISTFGASKWTNDLVGTPAPPSFVPNPFLSFTDHMSFGERMINTVMSAAEVLIERVLDYPAQNEMYENSFPDPKPSLQELKKSAVSLVLLNNHFSLSYPRPYATGMIEVGGMHINRSPKPLPDDIQRFMDNATDGIIYFSMGSNIKSKDLPPEKRQAFLNVFSKLKQKVLWKWEDDKLPSKPDNVRIQSWWPQDDILAHPNVRLFITHGGLLSTTESLYHGVPVIGIPVFGDQHLNMAKAERGGYGLSVAYQAISEERLSTAIDAILNDSTFKQNAQAISQRYRDQPQSPLELAVFWVEYIIRHKGAPHIRTAAMDLNFVQYHNLDIIATLIVAPILIIYLLSRLICRKRAPKNIRKNDRKKRN